MAHGRKAMALHVEIAHLKVDHERETRQLQVKHEKELREMSERMVALALVNAQRTQALLLMAGLSILGLILK